MQRRTAPVHRQTRFFRGWLLMCAAVVFALAISVFSFLKAQANPPEPGDEEPVTAQAIPLPAPLPLKHIPVPEPPDLMEEYVQDRQAAIELGKALFWDMQVGSDGKMACASCHFHAGADSRTMNTVNPGPDKAFRAALVNEDVTAGRYPFHQRNSPDFQDSQVTRDWDDITGSQGVRSRTFVDITPGQAVENTTEGEEEIFLLNGEPVRRVTNRNAPTVINAVFNFDNLWDGSANHIFNGVNPNGATDPNAKVFVDNGSGLKAEFVRIQNASLASQAVGPPMNNNEMSAAGRTFPKLGKKMLSLTPLGQQKVDPTDSVLGRLAAGNNEKGLNTTYEDMIKAAFKPKWWANESQIVTYHNGVPTISKHPGKGTELTTNQFTQMEANFSLFFGLAIQLYESTLVSDETPFDQVMEGKRAFTPIEELGNALFAGECAVCHAGSEFTTATHSNLAFGQGGPPPLVELMLNADFTQAIYDDGYFNIGVTKTDDDISRGNNDPFGRPLSYSKLGREKELGNLPSHFDPFVWELPANAQGDKNVTVNGAFKAPTLRNVELTGPYFHNGGVATLDQVLEFYTRGGNFPGHNKADLDPNMIEIPELQNHPEARAAIIAFLKTLTDERVRYEQAPFDHPELFVPNYADTQNPSNDGALQHIPAVGANGRQQPLQPYMPSDKPPVVVNDVFEVPFASQGVVLSVLLNDGDLDGDHITVDSVSSPSTNGATVGIGPEGLTVLYSAPVGFEGNDSFTYRVSDGKNTTEGTVNVTVQRSGTNRAPEALFDLFPVVQVNGTEVAVPVLANDQDLDGNPIYIISVDVNETTKGTAKIDPVGDQILFTPTKDFAGHTTLSYTISDGVATATAQVTLKINDWPLANDDGVQEVITVRAGSANNIIWVLKNDVDRNLDDIITVLAFDMLYKGTAFIDPTGTYISYTPRPGATGIERFTYFVGDGIVADSATVVIDIKPNTKPALSHDTFPVWVNSTDNVLNVLGNDTDADGDLLTISLVTEAAHGQVSIGPDNKLRYTPDPGYYGKDTFSYTAIDGYNGVSTAKVTVNVIMPIQYYIPFIGANP